jgi:hypothetical protein
MKAAELTMSYDRMIQCGAEKHFDAQRLKDWWGAKAERSLASIVAERLMPLSRILWVCFHLPALPLKAYHAAAAAAAAEYLRRAKEAGIYVDLRSAYALERKKAWIAGTVSLGELKHAHRRAESALRDVSELCSDPRAVVVAHAICQAVSESAETALRSFHYAIEEDPLAENGSLLRSCLSNAINQEEA